MLLRWFVTFAAVLLSILGHIQGWSVNDDSDLSLKPSSPFDSALEILQKQIGYTFQSSDLLRRAMTHSSYSKENNRALSILGTTVIDTAVAIRLLEKDIEISPKDLSRRMSDISSVESSCAVDAMWLGLQKIVRVSPKTNSTTPSVVCGAFRSIFGAISIDSGRSDDGGNIFWKVHGHGAGSTLSL